MLLNLDVPNLILKILKTTLEKFEQNILKWFSTKYTPSLPMLILTALRSRIDPTYVFVL